VRAITTSAGLASSLEPLLHGADDAVHVRIDVGLLVVQVLSVNASSPLST
jgi:hypothetical protein